MSYMMPASTAMASDAAAGGMLLLEGHSRMCAAQTQVDTATASCTAGCTLKVPYVKGAYTISFPEVVGHQTLDL
jgi:hypothetical protein